MNRLPNKTRWKAVTTGCLIFWVVQVWGQTVMLREEAMVSSDVIRLSELLPTVVPSEMRMPCGDLSLGRSPAIGTIRTLSKQEILIRLGQCPTLLKQVGVPGRVIVRRSGYHIREAAIREAAASFLRKRGMSGDLAGQPLQWTASLEAVAEDPLVEVLDAHWDRRQQRLQLRAHCVPQTLCKSFLILLPKPSAEMGEPLQADKKVWTGQEREKGPTLTQAGERATMLVQEGEVRISIPVTCLQRGRLGQQIRVLDPVSRHVFRATVLAERLLRLEPQPAGKS